MVAREDTGIRKKQPWPNRGRWGSTETTWRTFNEQLNGIELSQSLAVSHDHSALYISLLPWFSQLVGHLNPNFQIWLFYLLFVSSSQLNFASLILSFLICQMGIVWKLVRWFWKAPSMALHGSGEESKPRQYELELLVKLMWAGYLTFPCLSFLFCKVLLVKTSTPWNCCQE